MSVRIKIAKTAKELNDVFQLRYRVYVEQENVFGAVNASHGVIVDRFDALPYSANIIAYDNDEPVGTLRINLDTGAGVPPEELYDFTAYRGEVTRAWLKTHSEPPRFGSAGMLAIDRAWRKRRDVILALFKRGAGVGRAWEGDQIIAAVSAKTSPMYKRLGFRELAEKQWIESINDYIVPMGGGFENFYNWAFGDVMDNKKMLDAFANCFQRIVFGAGEMIFQEGDVGHEAYIVDSGTVEIARRVGEGHLTLATLGHGDIFGELSLIDTKPRSAYAKAITNCEVIVLDREDFLSELKSQPRRMHEMLKIFAERLRRADTLAAVLAQGSAIQRMEFALDDLHRSAKPDSKDRSLLVVRIGPVDFARTAGVGEGEARSFLEAQSRERRIEYTEHTIRFPVGYSRHEQRRDQRVAV